LVKTSKQKLPDQDLAYFDENNRKNDMRKSREAVKTGYILSIALIAISLTSFGIRAQKVDTYNRCLKTCADHHAGAECTSGCRHISQLDSTVNPK
jgi:hypothetical protein